jgi:hypothetical protein
MADTVTIEYTVKPTGPKTASDMTSLFDADAAPVPSWITAITGATVESDVTTTFDNNAVRTIIFDINNATFQLRFGNNPIAPFFGLMTGIIRAACNQPPIEAFPVAA